MDKSKDNNCYTTTTNRLIIFYGPPCAGKTTLSKIIANKLNIQRISIDSVRGSFKHNKCIFTVETNNFIFKEFLKKINRELNKNQTIICEGLFISNSRKKSIINLSSYQFNIIYITAPKQTLLRRLQTRRNDLSNSCHELMNNMTKDELIHFYNESSPPDQRHIIVDTGILNEIESVEKILNILSSNVFTKKTILDVF